MGEFKGFMKYEKQSLAELSLIERLEGHEAFQQRFSREEASIQGARCMAVSYTHLTLPTILRV